MVNWLSITFILPKRGTGISLFMSGDTQYIVWSTRSSDVMKLSRTRKKTDFPVVFSSDMPEK